MEAEITKQQFEDAYAERSGVTVEWLKEHGRETRPCYCEEEGCKGWRMAHVREDEKFEEMMRANESP